MEKLATLQQRVEKETAEKIDSASVVFTPSDDEAKQYTVYLVAGMSCVTKMTANLPCDEP